MNLRALSVFLVLFLACATRSGAQAGQTHSRDTGLSVIQLQNLARSLPPLPGRVQAFQLFRYDGPTVNGAVVLTDGENSGWQLFVFHHENDGKFALEWKSGKLDDSFAVSSGDQLRTYNLVEEQALEFSGCAAHACPDVFSVMLYVPSRKTAFTATYIRGNVTYSPPIVRGPGYQVYRNYLDQFIAKRRSATN